MAVHTFEKLEVWKRASRLAVDICVGMFHSKQFALSDQLMRCAISVPSNIAEGCERESTKDFCRFLKISKGSCAEMRTQLYICQGTEKELGIEILPKANEHIEETREISAMLQGLIFSLEKTSD